MWPVVCVQQTLLHTGTGWEPEDAVARRHGMQAAGGLRHVCTEPGTEDVTLPASALRCARLCAPQVVFYLVDLLQDKNKEVRWAAS